MALVFSRVASKSVGKKVKSLTFPFQCGTVYYSHTYNNYYNMIHTLYRITQVKPQWTFQPKKVKERIQKNSVIKGGQRWWWLNLRVIYFQALTYLALLMFLTSWTITQLVVWALYCTLPPDTSLAWCCGLGLGLGATGGGVFSGDSANAFGLWETAEGSALWAGAASFTVIVEAQTEEVSSASPPMAEW